MEKMTGIKLKLDMCNLIFINGNVGDVLNGEDDDYVTRIIMVLPLAPDEIFPGDYHVEYKSKTIDIRLQVITNPKDDPIMMMGESWSFGAPGTGVPSLPFRVFSDNRGNYPCVLAIVVFPYRLATWMDSDHPSGIRMDHHEAIQVIGPPDNQEKIVALVVLNQLFKSEVLKVDFRPLTYDEVTVFIEEYFKRSSELIILRKLNALVSKTAYRDAIQEHFLSGFDKQKIEESAKRLSIIDSDTSIEGEADLLKVVASAISDVLAHHVENRRWIDAFWDGERKIRDGVAEITIPRQPKSEPEIQPTIHVVLDIALSPLGIHVIRESDEGIGALDFRFLYTTGTGHGISVGTEFKLAHHKQLRRGIRNQLPAYLKAIRSRSGIFSVMWFKDQEGKFFREPRGHEKEQTIEWLQKEAKKVSENYNFTVITKLIDASIKSSASRITEAL